MGFLTCEQTDLLLLLHRGSLGTLPMHFGVQLETRWDSTLKITFNHCAVSFQ